MRQTRSADDVEQLMAAALAGKRAALAQLLSEIERGGERAEQVDHTMAARSGRGHVIGITGAPGAGKSTLLASLLAHVAARGEHIAALLVDPSSPISRGALLGDRVRMQSVATQAHVFARSMASRGHVGGLADMARRALRCLDACGWQRIFIETVGIGQVDVEVSTVADVLVVVLNPGTGDDVQVFKAGLMEMADIFVINKADHPQAQALRHDLAGMLASIPQGRPVPRVFETVATSGHGVDELWSGITAFLDEAARAGTLAQRRSERVDRELLEIMTSMLATRLEALRTSAPFGVARQEVIAGHCSLHSAARRLLDSA